MANALCLHGWGYTKEVFSFMSLLEHFNQVISPCLYQIADNSIDHRLNNMSEQLKVSASENTVLFGWSLGGLLALNMLGKTNNVKALVLIASSPVFVNKKGWQASIDLKEFNKLQDLLNKKPDQAIKQFNLLSMLGENKVKESAKQSLNLTVDKKHKPILQTWLLELQQADYREILSSISLPVLMLFGENDILIKPETTTLINNRSIETHVIKNCGHMPFINHSSEVVNTVNKFIERHVA